MSDKDKLIHDTAVLWIEYYRKQSDNKDGRKYLASSNFPLWWCTVQDEIERIESEAANE